MTRGPISRPYSKEDDDVVLNLSRGDAVKLLGRTPDSVDTRKKRLRNPDALRAAVKRHRDRMKILGGRTYRDPAPKMRAPAEVIAERDRRRLIDQCPCAALMGDPLPGYSALDRR